MISEMLMTVALALPNDPVDAPRRVVSTSRNAQNRWHDSGVYAVWDGVPRWIRDLGMCIRAHESHHNPNAENPVSTASGAYQYLDGTWQGVAKWVKVNGVRVAAEYRRASDAPYWVQDAAFIHTIQRGGIRAWHGTGCSGT